MVNVYIRDGLKIEVFPNEELFKETLETVAVFTRPMTLFSLVHQTIIHSFPRFS